MTARTVKTQKELIIDSERGVWLRISDTGSSTVKVSGSSTVKVSGSSTVKAWGSASVTASPCVAVHLHSARCTIEGGVVIDVTKLDLTDPQTWCEYHGVTVAGGKAVLLKAVDKDMVAGHRYRRTSYPVGEPVAAPDWDPRPQCGHGLHLTPSAGMSRSYLVREHLRGSRILECEVDVASMVCLDDKVEVPSLRVLREVTK